MKKRRVSEAVSRPVSSMLQMRGILMLLALTLIVSFAAFGNLDLAFNGAMNGRAVSV
jgi:hypothetical protein